MPDYKDGSGLQFVKLDFVAGGQEIKIALLMEFEFRSRYFVCFVYIYGHKEA